MGPKPKSEDKSTGKKSLVVGKTRSSKKSNSYLADDLNYKPFTTQLNKLGLQLRDITGDGNCCFRALSDQLEGAEGQHLEYRRRVCQYIRQNRDEFEPFIAALIEDDDADNKAEKKKPNRRLDAFDNYIRNLETPGTYADNGCLVAFARLYQVTINIHQLDLPIWTIQGVNPSKKNLHLAYHNGEHYSSIRRQGDTSNTPTEINFGSSGRTSSRGTAGGQKLQQSRSASSSATFYVADEAMHESNLEQIMNVTNCCDVNLIYERLMVNENNVEATINDLISELRLNGSDSGSDSGQGKANNSLRKAGKVAKVDRKREKKERAMERQRAKFLEQKEQSDANKSKSTSSEAISNSNQQNLENNSGFLISSSEIQSI